MHVTNRTLAAVTWASDVTVCKELRHWLASDTVTTSLGVLAIYCWTTSGSLFIFVFVGFDTGSGTVGEAVSGGGGGGGGGVQ